MPRLGSGLLPRAARLFPAAIILGLAACATPPAATTPALQPAAALVQTPAPPATASAAPPAPAGPPSPAPTVVIPALEDPATRAQVDQLASWFLGQGRDSALSVGIVVRDPRGGQLKAMLLNYGTSARDNGQPVTSRTLYEIGSITKVFTGILLGEALDSGSMRLGDPIQPYLPEGIQAPAYAEAPITLLDLATHRSGLPRDLDSDDIRAMYAWLNGLHLSRLPGSAYSYSNAGYSLLGDILARQAHSDYATLEYDSLSQPLGLPDTAESLDAAQAARLAQGYTYDGSPAAYFPQSGAMSGAGYLHSTLADMTRFLVENMQPGTTPLGAPLELAQGLQASGRNPGSGVGLGWEIDRLGASGERLYKGGATRGFTSYISFSRDRRAGFVLLANGMYVENLVAHMLHILQMDR